MCLYLLYRPQVHLAGSIKIVGGGGGLAGLIDSGPLARQSRRTEGLGARQAGPNRACFSCPEIGTALNCPGRLRFFFSFSNHFHKFRTSEFDSHHIWVLFGGMLKSI